MACSWRHAANAKWHKKCYSKLICRQNTCSMSWVSSHWDKNNSDFSRSVVFLFWFGRCLTHCGSLTPYDDIHHGTKPLPGPMLTYNEWRSVVLIWGHFRRQLWNNTFVNWGEKYTWIITTIFPRANTLMTYTLQDYFTDISGPFY